MILKLIFINLFSNKIKSGENPNTAEEAKIKMEECDWLQLVQHWGLYFNHSPIKHLCHILI